LIYQLAIEAMAHWNSWFTHEQMVDLSIVM
jgi:hypothetical protein